MVQDGHLFRWLGGRWAGKLVDAIVVFEAYPSDIWYFSWNSKPLLGSLYSFHCPLLDGHKDFFNPDLTDNIYVLCLRCSPFTRRRYLKVGDDYLSDDFIINTILWKHQLLFTYNHKVKTNIFKAIFTHLVLSLNLASQRGLETRNKQFAENSKSIKCIYYKSYWEMCFFF